MIDTHCHIYDRVFDTDRNAVIERAKQVGVEKIIMPNVDTESINLLKDTTITYPNMCYGMMGIHPCYVKEDVEHSLKIITEELKSGFPYVAIGEIGLDYYWDTSYVDLQKQAFVYQMNLAKHYALPISIHCRDAVQDTLDLVKQHASPNLKGIFHCFSGTLSQAHQAIEMGFMLGIGGVATFKNGGLDKILSELKPENLVLETDAPYLSPIPFRGKRNESSYLTYIAQKIAEIMRIDVAQLNQITTNNAKAIFRLP